MYYHDETSKLQGLPPRTDEQVSWEINVEKGTVSELKQFYAQDLRGTIHLCASLWSQSPPLILFHFPPWLVFSAYWPLTWPPSPTLSWLISFSLLCWLAIVSCVMGCIQKGVKYQISLVYLNMSSKKEEYLSWLIEAFEIYACLVNQVCWG